jgi:hypothetical protein
MGAYRKSDYQDPDCYMSQMLTVLERYPDPVVREATDPASGIQSTAKWPPSIAELKEVLEYFAARQQRVEKYQGMVPEAPRIEGPKGPPAGTVLVGPNHPRFIELGSRNPWQNAEGLWVPAGWLAKPVGSPLVRLNEVSATPLAAAGISAKAIQFGGPSPIATKPEPVPF